MDHIDDMRHLANKFFNGTIVIYDLATFQQTQILHSNSERYYGNLELGGFCLTSDILVKVYYNRLNLHFSAELGMWKFNHKTGLFGPDEMARVEFDWPLNGFDRIVYCWKKYIIVDSSQNKDDAKLRTVRVIDMKSLKQVKQRTFTEPYNILIKKECHGGIILSFEGNCLVTWNVEKDIVQPVTEHSRKQGGVYSARMDHHPDYQFEISYCGGKMKLDIFKIGGRQCIENCSLIKVQSKIFDDKYSTIMMNILEKFDFHSSKQSCYFDGVQLIFIGRDGLHLLEFDV